MFSMTAVGVHDGDLMHFDSGVPGVTLAGHITLLHRANMPFDGLSMIRCRSYHGLRKIIFLNSAITGLRRVNPCIQHLDRPRI
jgi:hypothetical protein